MKSKKKSKNIIKKSLKKNKVRKSKVRRKSNRRKKYDSGCFSWLFSNNSVAPAPVYSINHYDNPAESIKQNRDTSTSTSVPIVPILEESYYENSISSPTRVISSDRPSSSISPNQNSRN
jgi:hypothetical protein